MFTEFHSKVIASKKKCYSSGFIYITSTAPSLFYIINIGPFLWLKTRNVNEFNKLMTNNQQKMVCKVWASWCGHCKELNKIWPDIENEIEKEEGDGLLVSIEEQIIPSVNCLDAREIPGFPWIFSMKGERGQKKEYNGKRDVDSLVKYIKKKLNKSNSKKIMQNGGRKKRKTFKKKRKRRKKKRKTRRKKKSRKLN